MRQHESIVLLTLLLLATKVHYTKEDSFKSKQQGLRKNDNTTLLSPFNRQDVYDVVIIGAGWSGLAAAVNLESKGITNYKILEARDRIGGRAYTVKETWEDQEVSLDFGPMWLLGGPTSPLYKILLQHNISSVESTYYSRRFKSKNQGLVSDEQYNILFHQLFENGFYPHQQSKQYSVLHEDESLQVSVDEFVALIRNGEYGTDDVELKESFIKSILRQVIEVDCGGLLSQLSLWWWNSDNLMTNDYYDHVIQTGYSSLIEAYSSPIQTKIETEAKVTQVDYRKKETVEITYRKSNKNMRIKSKKILVTVPLGVLKAGTIRFLPELPRSMRWSIKDIGMGHIHKLFLFWNKQDVFWKRDVKQDVELFSDLVSRDTNFLFINPGAFNAGNHHLIAFFTETQENTFGMHTNEVAFQSNITKLAMASLRNMFGPTTPDPAKVIMKSWSNDEYSLGSYSFNQVNMDEDARAQLRQTIDDRVYFAGEASSDHFFGTTNGAYLTGQEAAFKISKSLNGFRETSFKRDI